MALPKEKYPNEYWAFQLGLQMASLTSLVEDLWVPFYPGDSLDQEPGLEGPDAPIVDRYHPLDQKLGDLHEILITLSQRDQKTKSAALKALVLLDGENVPIDTAPEHKDEAKSKEHKEALIAIRRDPNLIPIDETSYHRRPEIFKLFKLLAENFQDQRQLFTELSDSTGAVNPTSTKMGVFDITSDGDFVLPKVLPIFESVPWQRLEKVIREIVTTMGEKSIVVYETAIELRLGEMGYHLRVRLPYCNWSDARVCSVIGKRADLAITRLERSGFEISFVEWEEHRSYGIFSQIEVAVQRLSERLKQGGLWEDATLTVRNNVLVNIYGHLPHLEWKDVKVVVYYCGDGYFCINFEVLPPREALPVDGGLHNFGFNQSRDPVKPIKAWTYMYLLAWGEGKCHFVRCDKNTFKLDPDFHLDKPHHALAGDTRFKESAMKKQMLNLGNLLSEIVGIKDNPIQKQIETDGSLVWKSRCQISLVLAPEEEEEEGEIA